MFQRKAMVKSFFDFEDGMDPEDVDNLLSDELMQLSIRDRTAIQEEIHGVNCLATDETPSFLRSSLLRLATELDQNLPEQIAQAYRRSQELPNTYVNTHAFRLRFLRCELFDTRKAAIRMANFLNLLLDYYGEYALERPIRLSDMSKEELKYMRKGRYQYLPFRDRSGRRIGIIFPGKEMISIPQRIKAKLSIYQCWTAGDDVDTQRKGIVILLWYDKSFEMNKVPVDNKPKLHEVATVRISALHICSPDTPFFRFRRAVATMRAAQFRTKLQAHVGNTMELIYILQGYGIPTDTLPITYSGTVKLQSIRQWMRLRNFLEEPIFQNAAEIQSIIECPYPNDIVFRQGTSILTHPGNVTFRALIASKFEEIEKRQLNENRTKNAKMGKDMIKIRTRILVKEVMEEMQRANMRVLNWNDAQGFWKVLNDHSQIYLKVEYLVREHRNCARALANRQCVNSSTSMFRRQVNSGSCGGLGTSSENMEGEETNKKVVFAECFGKQFCEFPGEHSISDPNLLF